VSLVKIVVSKNSIKIKWKFRVTLIFDVILLNLLKAADLKIYDDS